MSNEIITNVSGIYCCCCLFLSRGCGPAGAEAVPRSDRERGLWSPKDQDLSGKSVNYQAISSRSLYVVSWMVAPQNICPPRTYKCELIWKKGLCTKWRVFKWDHPGLCRWALNPVTCVLIRERQRSIRGRETGVKVVWRVRQTWRDAYKIQWYRGPWQPPAPRTGTLRASLRASRNQPSPAPSLQTSDLKLWEDPFRLFCDHLLHDKNNNNNNNNVSQCTYL